MRCQSSMLPQHDDDTHDLARWLYHLATWLEGAEPPSASSCALHPRLARSQTTRLAQKCLLQSRGRGGSARARIEKNTLRRTSSIQYSYGHISHGRRGRARPLKAVSACSMKNISKVIARQSPAGVRVRGAYRTRSPNEVSRRQDAPMRYFKRLRSP